MTERRAELCSMCEDAPASTTWLYPVCGECADFLTSLQGDLKQMEADAPDLAEKGRRVEEAERFARDLIDLARWTREYASRDDGTAAQTGDGDA